MVKASNIFKTYDGLEVLKGVNLEVQRGELVSIIGKSGSGKSTLLHILGTLDESDSGQVIIDGIDVSTLNSKKLANFRNKKIGFIFQFHHLLPEFTALENICLPAYIANTSKKEAEAKAKELMQYLEIIDRQDHKPNQLSGGEAQRVAIARALINQPQAVFADEPTGNLDTSTSQEMLDLFVKLKTDFNQSFIIVTHDMELAKVSDRQLNMQDGLLLD